MLLGCWTIIFFFQFFCQIFFGIFYDFSKSSTTSCEKLINSFKNLEGNGVEPCWTWLFTHFFAYSGYPNFGIRLTIPSSVTVLLSRKKYYNKYPNFHGSLPVNMMQDRRKLCLLQSVMMTVLYEKII